MHFASYYRWLVYRHRPVSALTRSVARLCFAADLRQRHPSPYGQLYVETTRHA